MSCYTTIWKFGSAENRFRLLSNDRTFKSYLELYQKAEANYAKKVPERGRGRPRNDPIQAGTDLRLLFGADNLSSTDGAGRSTSQDDAVREEHSIVTDNWPGYGRYIVPSAEGAAFLVETFPWLFSSVGSDYWDRISGFAMCIEYHQLLGLHLQICYECTVSDGKSVLEPDFLFQKSNEYGQLGEVRGQRRTFKSLLTYVRKRLNIGDLQYTPRVIIYGKGSANQGARNDSRAIIDGLENNESMGSIIRKNPEYALRHFGNIIKLRQRMAPQRRLPTYGIMCFGPPGAGKSNVGEYVRSWAGDISTIRSFKWAGDGHVNDEFAQFDDINSSHFSNRNEEPGLDILTMLDCHPNMVEIKGAHEQFNYRLVIFTTNCSTFAELTKGMSAESAARLRQAVPRRFALCCDFGRLDNRPIGDMYIEVFYLISFLECTRRKYPIQNEDLLDKINNHLYLRGFNWEEIRRDKERFFGEGCDPFDASQLADEGHGRRRELSYQDLFPGGGGPGRTREEYQDKDALIQVEEAFWHNAHEHITSFRDSL